MKTIVVISILFFVLFFLNISENSFAQTTIPKSKLHGNVQKIEEWKDARFGMFIHWGPVTLKGTEIGWSRGREIPIEEYDNLYKQFDAKNFNANEWVSIAKAAGMKYIVLTTKHHDGFCLWDTQQSEYNIMNTPLKRDVVKELSEACKKGGIAFGTYFSSCDWYNPTFPLGSPGGKTKHPNPNLEAYDDYFRKQVAELITNYGPLLTMWFDLPQAYTGEYGIPMVSMLRKLQPNILINNRAYSEPGRTSGYSHQRTVGDYDTPEQRIGGFQIDRPWETCMTIADQWAWKPNDKVKSLDQCLQSLVRSAGGDGNLLFNVGPMPDGRIEPLQVERLKEMGQWLQKYGYTIYETRGGPFMPTDWGRCKSTIFPNALGNSCY
jgi:alpha-L-fucosidase